VCDQCPVRKLSTNRLLPCDDATQALDPPTDDRVPVRVHAPWMLYKALHLERLAGLRLHVFDIGEAANANFGGPGCPMRGEVAHGGAVVVILRSDDFGLLESEGKEQLRVEEAATRLVVARTLLQTERVQVMGRTFPSGSPANRIIRFSS
jgi:hypothetical protein